MKNLIIALIALLLVLLLGSIGFKWIGGEEWSWLDSVFMTVITITTTGYGETHPLSDAGRIFAIVISLAGVGTFLFALAVVTQFIVAGELKDLLGRRKMKKGLKNLKDHYVLCGFGRMGQEVARELKSLNLPFVILEKNRETLAEAQNSGYLYIEGDATQDALLKEAGIHRAKGLFSMLNSDADNLFVTLSARGFNDSLSIVARSGTPGTHDKLIRAGADRVVSPYAIGGRRMVSAGLKPTVVDFLDVVMHDQTLDLFLEEIEVPPDSPWIGKSVKEFHLSLNEEGVILSLCREEMGAKRFSTTNVHDHIIEADDRFVVLGTTLQVQNLERALKKAG